VLENLDEGIVALNMAGKTTMANRAAKSIHQRITGTRHSGATWTRSDIFFAGDASAAIPAHQLPGARALRGEAIRELEMVSMVPGRACVTVLVSAQPLLDRAGVQTGIVKLIRDITDIRKADRLKREFVAVVSHELRTPLTSIRGSLGLVNGGTAGALPEQARRLVGIAYRNTDRLATLINDILDIETIESGKLTLSSEQHSLRALVLQAIEAHSGYAHECDVSVMLQEAAQDALVEIDANRLLQVLANLLSNASKFSPRRGTVVVNIELHLSSVRVSVCDRGPGIPEEFRPYMFQKFTQVDGSDSRAKPGTGLGLAICKGLIARMRGTIDYEVQPDGGTVFFFELPLAGMQAVAAELAVPSFLAMAVDEPHQR
jgi:signal transduction histidine kinase